MLNDTRDDRSKALRMLQSGQLESARRAYETLLSAAPGDADLTGRLAQVALVEENSDEAEELLRRSLRLGSDARIRLRNLFELAILLQRTGRDAEVPALVAAEAPEWPQAMPAGKAWRNMVLWLVKALIGARDMAKARRVLNRAMPDRSGDADALLLDARLALEEGDQDAVLRIAGALKDLGAEEAVRAIIYRVVRRWAGYLDQPRASHRATILVCNPVITHTNDLPTRLRSLHFCDNFPAEFAGRMQDTYRFLSVFADLVEDPLPEVFHEADVVLNNVANPERLLDSGVLDMVRAHIDRTGLPVINHPDRAVQMTRDNTARLLAGVPGLKVPRIERYGTGGRSPGEVANDIEERFGFPLILRTPTGQSSSGSLLKADKTAILVRDPESLRAELERTGWQDFYVVEFVDLRRDDGFYRKLRAVVIDREVIVTQAAMYHDWMVSGWRDKPEGMSFYRANPQVIEECNRTVLDPRAALGSAALEALEAIRERLQLDMFGIDFDVDRTGRVVLFEASPVMLFRTKFDVSPADLRLPEEPLHRVDAAFHDLVARRIAAGPAAE